jgi:hypothetical protein
MVRGLAFVFCLIFSVVSLEKTPLFSSADASFELTGCKRPPQGPPGPPGTCTCPIPPPVCGFFCTHASKSCWQGAYSINKNFPILFNQDSADVPSDTAPPSPLLGITTNPSPVVDPSGFTSVVGYTDITVPVTGIYMVTWGVDTGCEGGQVCLAIKTPFTPLVQTKLNATGDTPMTNSSLLSLTAGQTLWLINDTLGTNPILLLEAGNCTQTGTDNVTAFVVIELIKQTGP